MNKMGKSPTKMEDERKKVYETIASKIASSNTHTTAMND